MLPGLILPEPSDKQPEKQVDGLIYQFYGDSINAAERCMIPQSVDELVEVTKAHSEVMQAPETDEETDSEWVREDSRFFTKATE